MPKVYIGLLFTILPGSAIADPPRYDALAYCEKVADVSGGGAVIKNSCVDMEQAAYDNLKADWNSYPSEATSYCDEVARVTGGSYSILESCIEMELSAGSTSKQFKY